MRLEITIALLLCGCPVGKDAELGDGARDALIVDLSDGASDAELLDAVPDAPVPDQAADLAPPSCAEAFKKAVPGYMECAEETDRCTFFYTAPAKSSCAEICGKHHCLEALANTKPDSCESSTDCSSIGDPVCTCDTKMNDGICTCAR